MKLFKHLQKFFKSKGEYPCEQMLGSRSSVNRLANFWENNNDDLGLIVAVYILDFVKSRSVTKREIDAYKQACGDVMSVFEKCYHEKELRVNQSLKPKDSD